MQFSKYFMRLATDVPTEMNHQEEADEFVSAVHSPALDADRSLQAGLRTQFAPWHHPVKQIVRHYQWSMLTTELLKGSRSNQDGDVLRYFTLPGVDLLDVKAIAEAVRPYNTKIEYFGFNASMNRDSSSDETSLSESFSVESALRQAGVTSDSSIVLSDRLEDIAISGSQAANKLDERQVFDVINIDACDHLGYVPSGRSISTFDALEKLLSHQLISRKPWLLFITTRADPDLLGKHILKMQAAIGDNMTHHEASFGPAMAECLEADARVLVSEISKGWASWSDRFIKIFSIGLGKYLLHYFHSKKPVAADVELKSVYAYRVKDEKADMLSFAFCITPRPIQAQSASIGGSVVHTLTEPEAGVRIVRRVSKVWMLDPALDAKSKVRSIAVSGTERLLRESHYDIDEWKKWLRDHRIRPIIVSDDDFIIEGE